MGGICPQDENYWCPHASDECENIEKPCAILTSAYAAMLMLRARHIEKIGKVMISHRH